MMRYALKKQHNNRLKRLTHTRRINKVKPHISIQIGGAKEMLTSIDSKSTIDKSNVKKLTPQKKELFKKMIGKYSTNIDMNKVREEYKR